MPYHLRCYYHWTSVSIQEHINEVCTSFWAVGCKWALWTEVRFILEANTVIKKKKKNHFLVKNTCKFSLGGIFIKLVFQQLNSNISRQPQSKQVLGEIATLPALQQNANMTAQLWLWPISTAGWHLICLPWQGGDAPFHAGSAQKEQHETQTTQNSPGQQKNHSDRKISS